LSPDIINFLHKLSRLIANFTEYSISGAAKVSHLSSSAFQFAKNNFDSIRFDSRQKIDSNRFESIQFDS